MLQQEGVVLYKNDNCSGWLFHAAPEQSMGGSLGSGSVSAGVIFLCIGCFWSISMI
jgi:hypothetical protein